MSAKKPKYEAEILEAIKGKPVYCFKDIFVYYSGISRQYAYEIGIDKSDKIRGVIDRNKQKGKVSMLDKWIKGDNATLQLAAMRLIGDDDIRRRLNQQYVDHTTAGEKINIIVEKFTPSGR